MCQMPQVRSILVIICILSSLCAIVVQTQPMTKTSTDFQQRSRSQISTGSSLTLPETLPRDTFRLLAKALYQRDDKAANRLERKYFYNQSITCNEKPPREKERRKHKVPVLRQSTFLWNCSCSLSCALLHAVLQQEIV